MTNSLTRPMFYDEEGQLQQSGERFWTNSRIHESYVAIKIPYWDGITDISQLTPEVDVNPFFSAQNITLKGENYEQESITAVTISISMKNTRKWNADFNNLSFVNCNQDNSAYTYTQLKDGDTWEITVEEEVYRAQRDGYMLIEIPFIESNYISVDKTHFLDVYWMRASYITGEFQGIAEYARKTTSGHPIGRKWYLDVISLRTQQGAGVNNSYYVSFTLYDTKYRTSITIEEIYEILKKQGYYESNVSPTTTLTSPALPATYSDETRWGESQFNTAVHLGSVLAHDEDTGSYVKNCIRVNNADGGFALEVGLNGSTIIVHFKQTEF